jgi:CIC family chloride channel protein
MVIRKLPRYLPIVRRFLRSRESGLSLVSLVIGAMSGVLVAVIGICVQLMHSFLFDIGYFERLSAVTTVSWQRALIVPTSGGLFLAAISIFLLPRLRARIVDVIEANALHGGRLSVKGSALLTLQTIVSSGCGASVGLEAGYTQICAAISSLIGQKLAARRADIRMLVGAGAAGAIGAAFGAPLAGAFYAFEVVLGSYSVATLAPVAISALCASMVARRIAVAPFVIGPSLIGSAPPSAFIHVALIGFICAIASILVMRSVAIAETLFARSPIPIAFRPAVGGLAVGAMALATPQVMGAGHAALRMDLATPMTATAIFLILVLKSLASAVSLGSGFRGGLFFASLLIGALTGLLYSDLSLWIFAKQSIDPGVAAVSGMAAMGAGIVGAPVALTALALETTGDFSITAAALVASTVSSLLLRELFGYSFATWRFHLRGEAIWGPQDVGWIRDLTVAKLMRSDVQTIAADLPISNAKALFPPGAAKQVALLDSDKKYFGLMLTGDLYSVESATNQSVLILARYKHHYLLPTMNIRDAVQAFSISEADALVVVDNKVSRHVIGIVTEAYLLRRYGQELERRLQDETKTFQNVH